MFDFAFVYTAVLILIMAILLIRDVFEPDVTIFSVLILMILGGVVNVKEAFAGFSNHGMLAVLFLFVVAAAVRARTFVTVAISYYLSLESTH